MRRDRSSLRDASSISTGDKMELNKNVSNPMLVGVMQLIKADGKTPDPKHQEMFMEELDKADQNPFIIRSVRRRFLLPPKSRQM